MPYPSADFAHFFWPGSLPIVYLRPFASKKLATHNAFRHCMSQTYIGIRITDYSAAGASAAWASAAGASAAGASAAGASVAGAAALRRLRRVVFLFSYLPALVMVSL